MLRGADSKPADADPGTRAALATQSCPHFVLHGPCVVICSRAPSHGMSTSTSLMLPWSALLGCF